MRHKTEMVHVPLEILRRMNVRWGYVSSQIVPSDETALEKTTDYNSHKHFLWKAGGM